jgi:hypothetical protein
MLFLYDKDVGAQIEGSCPSWGCSQLRKYGGVPLLYDMQVSEAELEAIARMGDAAALDVEMAAAGAGGAATRALLGEYTTPARCAL